MNIYLVTFDFTETYGMAHAIVAAKNEDEAIIFAKNSERGFFYPVESVTLLDPAEYPAGGFIMDIVYIE